MNNILVTLFLLIFSTGLSAQDNSDYMMVMVKQKKAYNMARTEQDFQNLAHSFERIANAESDQWHPLYYAGLCYINMSLVSTSLEKKDPFLDQAQAFIDKALEIYPDESELYALQALLHQGRIQVDREQRSASYSKKAAGALEVAMDYNPDNPRIYYLMGLNVMFSTNAAGEGVESACKFFKTANEKFNSFLPQHVLSPSWGGEQNYQFYTQYCIDQN